MMLTQYDVIIVGAGIFGITAAIEMNNRGYSVAVLDPGPLPHPLAASTDISKAIRLEHGSDEAALIMAERALLGWERWNRESAEQLYFQTGVATLTRAPMASCQFEYESYQMLLKHDHRPERLDSDDIARRFPVWKAGAFVDGFCHSQGGYVESGRVVSWLAQIAEVEGVSLHMGQTVESLLMTNGHVTGVHTQSDETFLAGHVIIAAGAWTPLLVPELSPMMQISAQPVFHLKPADNTLFTLPHFPIFATDATANNWSGFPLHPREGIIKLTQRTLGQTLHPNHDPRTVSDVDIRNLRTFLDSALPVLKEATITYTRRCLACHTADEQLWIGNHPAKPGLTVATGGSGYGFMFAPILGEIIADTVEDMPMPRFKWREIAWETAEQT